TERKAIEETKPSGIGLAQNGCDGFPFRGFAAAGAVLSQQGEENQHNDYGKHSQRKRVPPTKFLSEAGRDDCGDQSARTPCTSDAHDEPVMLGRIHASRDRKSYGETRACDTQQEPEKIVVCESMREAPAENQREQSECKSEHAGPVFTNALSEKSQHRPE